MSAIRIKCGFVPVNRQGIPHFDTLPIDRLTRSGAELAILVTNKRTTDEMQRHDCGYHDKCVGKLTPEKLNQHSVSAYVLFETE
ncbi:hypothetical protein TcasGA2_TC013216 [Tribolium castaneum]|uniref:Uncharacterized protein n=1 Tax=Tribolium castaneum TaxID=7070 RepID=D6WMM1_TRICA|nr:hypothetical protein TcasGA2_TC013216 [Tribolium castaneum]